MKSQEDKYDVSVTRNKDEIKEVIFREDIFPFLALKDDVDNKKDLFKNGFLFYSLKYNDKTIGIAIFDKFDEKLSIVDAAIIPDYRGKIGYKLSKIALIKFFSDNPERSLITRISKKNKPSLYYSLMLGFRVFYEDDDSKYLRIDNYGRNSK